MASDEFGLSAEVIERIRGVFAVFPQIDEAILYGSRAKGNYRTGSDIDLTLKGKGLDLTLLNRIAHALDDLLLPYTIDLSSQRHIDNPELLDHIDRVGRTFYRR